MKLEQQVCSLELARELNELGTKQDSLFWWQVCEDSTTDLQYQKTTTNFGLPVRDWYSAFTVAELGNLLGKHCLSNSVEYGWACSCWGINPSVPTIFADTEADARAKMLIFLIENGFMGL